MVAVVSVDELSIDAETVAGLTDTPFQHGPDFQFLTNLSEIVALLSELERRRPRHYPQPVQLRQSIDQLFGEAVAEVLLLRVGAHVRERQDGD